LDASSGTVAARLGVEDLVQDVVEDEVEDEVEASSGGNTFVTLTSLGSIAGGVF
jgi:hypothetical protein